MRVAHVGLLALALTGCEVGGYHLYEKGRRRRPPPVADTRPPVTTAVVTSGPGPGQVYVTFVVDEPATVYVTTDGTPPAATPADQWSGGALGFSGDSTLRFFAVDLAGNVEAEKSLILGQGAPPVPGAPVAALAVDRTSARPGDPFTFDASGSTDPGDATSTLQVRWDFDGDLVWDTAFSTTKTVVHRYAREGTRTVRLEVRDPGGLTSLARRVVGVARQAADLDGDGYLDLVVGAPDHEGSGPGKVHVFFGGPGFAGRSLAAGQAADRTFVGQAAGDHFGAAVALGDLSGDGVADLVVGALDADAGGTDSGRVYLFRGGAGFASRDLSAGAAADATFTGPAAFDQLGYTLATGDLDGDGVVDLACGAPHESASGALTNGRVYVFRGGSGLASVDLSAGGAASFTLNGLATLDCFGLGLAAGDVTGDLVDDLLVGAAHEDGGALDAGAVHVFAGGAAFGSVDLAAGGSGLVRFLGEAALDELGFLGLAAGDVTGDGVGDVVAGAYLNDVGGDRGGRVYVFRGGPGLTSKNLAAGQTADVTFTGVGTESLGNALALVDVDRDGDCEVVTSGVGSDLGGTDAGRVHLFFGGPGLASVDLSAGGSADRTFSGAAAGDRFGSGLGGGDVTADGFSDVVIGAIYSDAGGVDAGRVHVVRGGVAGSLDDVFTGEAGTTRFGAAVGP